MKKLLATICAGAVLGLMASCDDAPGKAKAYNQGINIIPTPVSLTQNEGNFKLNKNTKIYASTPEAKTVAEFFAAKMNTATGYQIATADKETSDGISLVIDGSLDVNDEGYTLDVADSGVRIKAKTPQGLFYGMQSFLQLLPAEIESPSAVKGIAWTAPAVSIKDEPRFGYRGIMLDPCRHFIPVENIKKQLDVLALFKINRMHWHLTDDQGWRIEIKKYPKLTEVGSVRSRTLIGRDPGGEYDENCKFDETPYGGYYTQDEIRDIVKYADDRGIKVIPEIEVPGHASASIYAYPWIGATSRREGKAVVGDLYDVTDPKVEEFLHDILDEVVALFPSKIVHIGGDEANYTHWQNSEEIQAFMKANGLPTCSDLQVWAINRMSKYLASKGCRMIGWNEITGDNVRGEAHVQASQSERLAPGTIVQFWDGDISLVNKAIEKGYDVVNSNRFFTYLDYPYEVTPFEKAYSFNPIPDGLADADKEKILGTGCQMWGEFTPNLDRLYYQIFPRIAAYAECGWTPADKKYYEDFRKRLKKIENIWKEKGYLKTQLDKY